MPIFQSIRTRLWPIQGLDLKPDSPEGDIILGADVPLTLAIVAGRAPQGTALLSLADDGSLKVAVQGAALSSYSFNKGIASDDYSDTGTVLYGSPQAHFTVAVSAKAAVIQLRNPAGQWGSEIDMDDGDILDYDLQITGFRIKNATAGDTAKWQIMTLA